VRSLDPFFAAFYTRARVHPQHLPLFGIERYLETADVSAPMHQLASSDSWGIRSVAVELFRMSDRRNNGGLYKYSSHTGEAIAARRNHLGIRAWAGAFTKSCAAGVLTAEVDRQLDVILAVV